MDREGRTTSIVDAHRDGRELQEIWFLTFLRVIEILQLRQVRWASPQEFHLTFFPQGNRERQGRSCWKHENVDRL